MQVPGLSQCFIRHFSFSVYHQKTSLVFCEVIYSDLESRETAGGGKLEASTQGFPYLVDGSLDSKQESDRSIPRCRGCDGGYNCCPAVLQGIEGKDHVQHRKARCLQPRVVLESSGISICALLGSSRTEVKDETRLETCHCASLFRPPPW